MTAVPGRLVKKELGKLIVAALLAGKVDLDTLSRIEKEIDVSKYTTSDPDTIIAAVEAGLVGEQVGSVALGFEDEEYKNARADHAERIKRIAESQGAAPGANPAARGVKDLAVDTRGGETEKAESRETDLQPTTRRRTRGKGKRTRRKTNAD